MSTRYLASAVTAAALLAVCLTGSHTWAEDEWEITTVDSDGRAVAWTSLEIDPSGRPAISYIAESALRYAWRSGDTWHHTTIRGINGIGTSLAFGADGYPAISIQDGRMLRFVWKEADDWHAIVTVDTHEDTGAYSSLAFDDAGNPVISYLDAGQGTLNFAWREGSRWYTMVVDSDPGRSVGAWTSLAIGPDGYPAISYCSFADSPDRGGELRFARMHTDGWRITVVDEGPQVGAYTSLVFGPDGSPAISYHDSAEGTLRYAWQDRSGWHTTTIECPGEEVGLFTSLAFAPSGRPAIAHHRGSDGDLLYTRSTVDGWQTVTVDSEGAVGEYASLAFEPQGLPTISYSAVSGRGLRCARLTRLGTPTPGQPIDVLWNYISFPLDTSSFDAALDPTAVFAYEDLLNKLLQWHPYSKQWQMYPYDFLDVQVGRGYALFVPWGDLAAGYLGWPAPYPFEYPFIYRGHNLIGCPRNEKVPLSTVELRRYYHGGWLVRTSLEDASAPDPWLNWNWVYWDSVAEGWRICHPVQGQGDDSMARPWYAYWVWQYEDDVRLVWP